MIESLIASVHEDDLKREEERLQVYRDKEALLRDANRKAGKLDTTGLLDRLYGVDEKSSFIQTQGAPSAQPIPTGTKDCPFPAPGKK